MQIECDPDKREATLAERGLDMLRAGEIFAGPTLTVEETTGRIMVSGAISASASWMAEWSCWCGRIARKRAGS